MRMPEIHFEDWGCIDYAQALTKQQLYFEEALHRKEQHLQSIHRWCFCEHPPVLTLGKHAHEGNILVSEAFLQKHGIGLFHIERGGDVTFHGPGQMVCYPIIDLDSFHIGLRQYIHLLEEVVIRTLLDYQIEAARVEGASGVWLGVGTPSERKICAIGVKSSRFVTMHGLAFNVTTDLSYFSYIHPCGFLDKAVTSLQQELNHSILLEEVAAKMRFYISLLFGEVG